MKLKTHRVAMMAILLAATLSAIFAGCGQQDSPTLVERPDATPTLLLTQTSGPTVPDSTVLNGYLVQFDGRSVVGSQTTFSYTVTGVGGAHALSHFLLEIPDCAPDLVASSPAGGTVGVDPLTGLYGVKWDSPLGTTESRSYSMTFLGDVPMGVILASVKASTTSPTGEIAGPCGGFLVSGTVFVDADSSGHQIGPDEIGIANVTVTMIDLGGNEMTALSDINGDYAFLRVAGTYALRIDAVTSAEDFNEVLAENFDPTTPATVPVTVGPDSPDNDFGYYPQAEEITLELAAGTLLTTGEPPKYWIKQVRGGGRTDYDSATIDAFLTEIQGLYLPDPFRFTPGNEKKEAIDILKSRSKDPIDQLLKELLAAEFNEVSGKGLVGEEELQSVLLAWVESLIAQADSGGPTLTTRKDGGGGPQRVEPSASRDQALELLRLLNGATGGGGGGGEG
jgi:hypothetical protein